MDLMSETIVLSALPASHVKFWNNIIRSRVLEHQQQDELMNSSQHGVTAKRSCLNNFLTILEKITKAIDEHSLCRYDIL